MITKNGRTVYKRPTIIYNKSNPMKYHDVIGEGYTEKEIQRELESIVKSISGIKMVIKDDLTPLVKPPVGLIPQVIWYEQRIQSIEEAIERYRVVGKDIPYQWTIELLELTKILL